jgi:hypothetical protein
MLAFGREQLFAVSNCLGIIQDLLRELGIIRLSGSIPKPYR